MTDDLSGLQVLHAGLELLTLGAKDVRTFGQGIRSNVRGLWTGVFNRAEFIEAMSAILRRGYTQAWREGAQECGINPTEFTDAEQAELNQVFEHDLEFARGFADSIIAAPRGEGKLATHFARAELWTNSYNRVLARAQQLACADQKLMWMFDPLKDHCTDCAKLHGRVHRASTWSSWGIQPQMRDLECRGYRCGCRFVVTTLPTSRLPRPRLVGGG